MSSEIPAWIGGLTTGGQRWLTGWLTLAVLLILWCLFRDSVRYWRESHQITGAVKRLGARAARDVCLPDDSGADINIDFLVVATDAIVVVGVKRYDGFIYGSTQTNEWVQVINSRSYRFPNPDVELLRQINAVSALVPDTPVRGLHLFTDKAVFPRDKPSNVLQVKDLLTGSRPGLKDIPLDLGMAWRQVIQAQE
jgi:hypothetical protein